MTKFTLITIEEAESALKGNEKEVAQAPVKPDGVMMFSYRNLTQITMPDNKFDEVYAKIYLGDQ